LSALTDVPLRQGLDQAATLEPGHGFAELLAGVRSAQGGAEGFVNGKLGVKLAEHIDAFGFGEASLSPGSGPSWQAGVGLRATF
jgi:hypothetical protein